MAATSYDSDPTNPLSAIPLSISETYPLPSLRIQRIADTTDDYLVTIDQPDTDTSLPVLFIDVLDISGSMGCPASDNTTREAAAFTRADLVRHSVATQIELLRPQDSLAVVLFDHNSRIVLPPTQDSEIARTILPEISANGGTNIWGGLFKALQIAEEQTTTTAKTHAQQNVTILLQTDGQSDPSYNPPRGIVPTLRAWLDSHPTVRLTIHTIGYGMGPELDTPLLTAIANTTGGTYNYIPDGSMVGTVFIHLMANLMSIVHKDLVLQIPEAGYYQSIGSLQSGQVKELVISLPTRPTTLALRNATDILVSKTVTPDDDTLPAGFPSAVRATLSALRLALLDAERTVDPVLPNPLTDLQTTLQTLLHTDPSHRMMALLTDLSDRTDDKGQISKALASAASFRRWGRHYIPTVISSLENGWAINFKDTLSTEVFGTLMTHLLVERGDAIFMALPPPTVGTHSYSSSSHPTPAASMASIHSSAGPCFLPGSLMRMADGTEKRCDQVRPGDRDASGYTIQCVIKTVVPYADIVRLEGPHRPDNAPPLPDDAGFTLWHPVLPDHGEWVHPATLGTVERVPTDAIYNFVLAEEIGAIERPGMLIINGFHTCAMGHPFRANAVIDHPYFGAPRPNHRHILDDLQQQPGWKDGYVTWGNLQVSHDAVTGMINGMRPV